MIQKAEKIKSWHIICFSALLFVSLFFVKGTVELIKEKSAIKDGSLAPFILSPSDFDFDGIKENGEGYKTTYDDAKLILEKHTKLSSVRFTAQYSISPGEVVLYYKEPGDTDFSAQKRRWVYADDNVENGYIITLPLKEVTRIRIDPTMYRGNEMILGDFRFNREKSVSEYYSIDYTAVYNLILYTAVLSACLKYLQELILKKFD